MKFSGKMFLFSLVSLLLLVITPSSFAANMVVFDKPGDYTWVVPANVTEIWVSGCGGGAGGNGYHSTQFYTGAGGSSGGFILKKKFAVTPGRAYSIVVGSGGEGAKGSNLFGFSGGSTSMSQLFTLTGGSSVSQHTQVPGAPGVPNGSIGENGRVGTPRRGGSTPFGEGGIYSWGDDSPGSHFISTPGTGYGAGGAGGVGWHNLGYSKPANGGKGTAGASGLLIIEW